MAGFLSKLGEFTRSFSKSESVIGVDIGASALKIVELEEKGGKATLKNYGELALGPYGNSGVGEVAELSDDRIAQAIRDLLREAEIESRFGTFAIPLNSTLLSFIEVPTRDEEKLDNVIQTEARKYIPVPLSEVVLDWWVLPEDDNEASQDQDGNGDEEETSQEGKTAKVVISAIHNETLEKYQRIQEAAELDIPSFEIEIFSIIRSVIGEDMSPIMVLDIGAGTSKLAVVEFGIVKNYHIINRGSQDVTTAIARAVEIDPSDAERIKREQGLTGSVKGKRISEIAQKPLAYIFSEAQSAIGNFERTYDTSIQKVVLTGGGVLLGGLEDMAREYFQVEVVRGDPFRKIRYPAYLEDTLREIGPEFAVAIGASLKALQEQ